MKIEPNMYVRYKRSSNGYGIEPPERIAKVLDRINNSDFLKLDTKQDILESDVVKADRKIIDLIKVGDYVNGELVCEGAEGLCVWYGEECVELEDEDIESILTKEQFETIVYKVN